MNSVKYREYINNNNNNQTTTTKSSLFRGREDGLVGKVLQCKHKDPSSDPQTLLDARQGSSPPEVFFWGLRKVWVAGALKLLGGRAVDSRRNNCRLFQLPAWQRAQGEHRANRVLAVSR